MHASCCREPSIITAPTPSPDRRGGAQHAPTAKGRIRVELERRLAEATTTGTARALIVRAGDFFGPQPGNNWFGQGIVRPGRRPRVIRRPGKPGVGHQWAYLPDVAETMVRLAERDDLEPFARFHMDGHWDPDGSRMTDAIRRALRAPAVPVRPLPWWAMRLASPPCRCCASCWRCAICGSSRCGSTIAGWSRSSATSRTPRSIRPSGRRWPR
ncbi:hypothetical protein ACFSTI_26435 [Rhizorhabdus histidinilytica]